MIQAMAAGSRLIALQLEVLLRTLTPPERALHGRIDAFLDSYCAFHGIAADEAAAGYARFVEQYVKDMRAFREQCAYPGERGAAVVPAGHDYHLFLLASPLLTRHRFRIMERVSRLGPFAGAVLCLGAGTCLELALLDLAGCDVEAYDPGLASFARTRFPDVVFHERPFAGGATGYDAALAIELLEHLPRPLELVATVAGALREGAVFCFTTARNVPQFDHVVNFTEPGPFEAAVREQGLVIEERETIAHQFLVKPEDCDNVFYVARKRSGTGWPGGHAA